MKIGLVFKPYVSIKQPFRGGMGNFVYLLSKKLAQQGHEATVLCGRDSKLPTGVKKYSLGYPDKSMDVYRAGDDFYRYARSNSRDKIGAINLSFGELSARFDRKIESYLSFFALANSKKFDIVHVVTHDILALYPALFSQVPGVISFHGHWDLLGPDFVRWLEFIKKNQLRHSATFVSVSKFIQKEYRPFINSKLIYNGIEVDKYKPIYKKENYLAFLSRIDYYKGLDFAVDFSRKYKIPLKIGGNIEDKIFFNQIKTKIDNKLIQYLGPQNEKQKNELLGRARATIMSSHYREAFGRVTAESLACATPVIAFDKGANPELVIEGKTGFLIRENNFSQAKKAWDKIGQIKPEACRRFAEKNFNINDQILKYLDLYKKIKN